MSVQTEQKSPPLGKDKLKLVKGDSETPPKMSRTRGNGGKLNSFRLSIDEKNQPNRPEQTPGKGLRHSCLRLQH